jgi:hypothetical protein
MGRECRRALKKCTQNFSKDFKEKDPLEDLRVDGRILLKWTSKYQKKMLRVYWDTFITTVCYRTVPLPSK